MPLYEYQCGSCGDRIEKLESMSAPRVQTCTRCGGELHRLPGVPALQFKGSGWYVTDYGKGRGRGESEKKEKSESAPSSSAPAKTESTPKAAKSA